MDQRRFARFVLKVAGIYNVLWGAWVVVFPMALFDWAGLQRPLYPEIWQCVGMIVGVYGVGYWLAASNVDQHWVIVLVGFLGKICGPIGFAWTFLMGGSNLRFGSMLLLNDLIWWVPFALILIGVWKRSQNESAKK